MKQILKQFLAIGLLIMMYGITHAERSVATKIKTRPQSLNGARKVSGEVPGLYTHKANQDDWYGLFWVAPAYQHSFHPQDIARSLFGDALLNNTFTNGLSDRCNNGCNQVLLIQGTYAEGDSANRNPYALRAEDFYLSDEYNGILSFKPSISNFILDFNAYIGFDRWAPGLYLRLYAPFVHTRWNLCMKETILSGADATVNGGKFSPTFIEPNNLLDTARSYFAGAAPDDTLEPAQTSIVGDNATAPYTIVRNPLNFGRLSRSNNGSCCGNNTKNGFGEIRAELGWDFLRNDNYHLGIYLAAAAPTGNRAKARYLFSPVVGNGKHWELGGGLTGHWVFWRSEDENHHIGIYGDIVATHLFNARDNRVFDLNGVNGPLSRYMLAAKYQAIPDGGPNILSGNPTANTSATGAGLGANPASYQFTGELTPVANLTAQDVRVNIGAQVDLTAWFNYTTHGLSVDLGYNLWFQSAEKFCYSTCKGPKLRAEPDTWALIGDAQLFGSFAANSGVNAGNGIAIAASESHATITTGTNGESAFNAGVDSAQFASANNSAGTPFALVNFAERTNNFATANQISLSIPPTFLSERNINLNPQNKSISHKVFGHISYAWECEAATPFLSIGGEAEFGAQRCVGNRTACTTNCAINGAPNSCHAFNTAISQWGVWVKAGVTYN